MKLETEKLELIQWIIDIQDQKILRELLKLSKANTRINNEPWDIMPKEEKEAILQGIASIERGEYLDHEAVMNEIRTEFGF